MCYCQLQIAIKSHHQYSRVRKLSRYHCHC